MMAIRVLYSEGNIATLNSLERGICQSMNFIVASSWMDNVATPARIKRVAYHHRMDTYGSMRIDAYGETLCTNTIRILKSNVLSTNPYGSEAIHWIHSKPHEIIRSRSEDVRHIAYANLLQVPPSIRGTIRSTIRTIRAVY